jgi:hypothetical protein
MSLELFAIGSSGLALVVVVVMVMSRCGTRRDGDWGDPPVKNWAEYRR